MNESCDCLGGYDDDGPSFYKEIPVAKCRKTYKCSACSAPISKGSPATVAVGAWDGCLEQYRYHPNCLNIIGAASVFYGTGFMMSCSIDGCVEGWYEDAKTGGDNGKLLAKLIEDFSDGPEPPQAEGER